MTRTLTVDLAAPSVSYTAPASLKVDVAITAVTPTTADTDIASYSATGLPVGTDHPLRHRRYQRHPGHGRREHREPSR